MTTTYPGTPAPKTGRTTYHKDGTVTLWDVYTQGWVRSGEFSNEVLASLPDDERQRVIRHTSK